MSLTLLCTFLQSLFLIHSLIVTIVINAIILFCIFTLNRMLQRNFRVSTYRLTSLFFFLIRSRFINIGYLRRIEAGRQESSPQELSGLHFYNKRKSGEGEKTTFFCFLCKAIAGKLVPRGWSCPRSLTSSWDGPPSGNPWLYTGKNSRASHRKQSRDAHSMGGMWAILEGRSSLLHCF